MSKQARGAVYGLLMVLAAILASLGQQIQAGAVPIPPEHAWLAPVLVAGIVALTGAIKSMSED